MAFSIHVGLNGSSRLLLPASHSGTLHLKMGEQANKSIPSTWCVIKVSVGGHSVFDRYAANRYITDYLVEWIVFRNCH